MSYQVLARKYRPHSFEEMVGQEHVVQALSNALTQQRLHHAYLFTGTRGVGKTTVSRILAKSLNCTGADGQGGITATPCGVCEACRDIDSGRFVDYVELDAASNRGVEEISQLLDQAVYKPVVGRFKVYMIDEVHMLSNTAFNAMLKTLEEPPEYLKFVLATTDPQKVPVTVLSRCLQFNLRPMAPQNVLSHLTQVLAAESVPAEPGALRLLARAARGSMRDALSLTDQAIAFGAGQLQEAGVRQMLGTVDRGHVAALIDALAASAGAQLVAQVDQLRGLGLSASGTLEDLAALLQQMAIAQVAPAALDGQDPESAEVLRLASLLPADEIQLMYSMALHGRQELALAPDEYAGLLMVLLRMLSFRPGGQGISPSTIDASNRTVAAGAPVRTAAPAGAAPVSMTVKASATPVAAMPLAKSVATPVSTAVLPAPSPAPAPEAPLPPSSAPSAVQAAPASNHTDRADDAPAPEQVAGRSDLVQDLDQIPQAMTASATAQEVSRPLAVGRGAASSQQPSARLRPRPVVRTESAEAADGADDAELPPWLDAPPADESGLADGGFDAMDLGLDESAPASGGAISGGVYASTAGTEVVLQPTALGERWAQLVQQLGLQALARELAMQAECIGLDEHAEPMRWQLRVERESLRQPALIDKLQAALAEGLGRRVKVDVEPGVAQDSPALRAASAAQSRQRRAEQIILEDPLVKTLLAQFKTARIVPGSIKPH